MNITPEQMVAMMLHYIEELDVAQKELESALHDEAIARKKLTKVRAIAWREVKGSNREIREALVDEQTIEERFDLDIAVGDAKSAMESVRNKRQQLSGVQSASNSIKEDAQFSRTGPADGVYAEAYIPPKAPTG